MDLWPLRTLVLDLNLSAHGVAATVTRPAPDNTPISTSGLWLVPREDAQPFGTDFRRAAPRRVFVVPQVDVPTMPRGTVIQAPEATGGTVKTWRVDEIDRAADPDHWRAVVVET